MDNQLSSSAMQRLLGVNKIALIWSILFGLFVCSAEAQAASPTTTQQVPKEVEAYSAKLDAKCAAADSSDTASAPEFVKLAAEGPYGKIFVVDGAYSRCGDTGPFCGTGGCPVAVFSSKAGVTKKLYDDQALGWKISQDGVVLTLNVHGSKCGGFGPDPCITEIDLRNGKRRTLAPH